MYAYICTCMRACMYVCAHVSCVIRIILHGFLFTQTVPPSCLVCISMFAPPHLTCARPANINPLCHGVNPPVEGGPPGKRLPKRPAIGKGWPRCARGVSRLLASLSPSSSHVSHRRRSRTTADPSGTTKRLSLLQAVAQGYGPMAQEEAEQEVLQGNQSAESKADC